VHAHYDGVFARFFDPKLVNPVDFLSGAEGVPFSASSRLEDIGDISSPYETILPWFFIASE
jgi:hypothetical protein